MTRFGLGGIREQRGFKQQIDFKFFLFACLPVVDSGYLRKGAKMDFDFELNSDSRTFTEKMFFDSVDGKLVVKKTARIDCSDGVPEALPEGRICLLTNYKVNISRGRKDPLRGKDVIAVPSDKGWVMLPLQEAKDAASFLFSYASSLENYLQK